MQLLSAAHLYSSRYDLGREWVHEWEDSRDVLGRLLDHDADAKTHERLAEVDDSFTRWRYSQRSYGKVCFLYTTSANTSE